MFKLFITGFIALLFLVTPLNVAFAQTQSSSSAQIMQVNSIANLRDRIFERITLFFKFSNNSKADYEQYLAEKRFAELKYVLDSGQGDLIEETSSRYSSYIGRLTNLIVKNKMVDKKEAILQMYESELPILEKYSLQQDYNSGFWLLLQHDINYIKIYSDQIKNIH